MPDQTNITDFDPATGLTTTTLVETHDRGAQAEAARDGQEHVTWHRDDMPGGGGGGGGGTAPSVTSVSPASAGITDAPLELTVTGARFTADSVVRIGT